MESSPNQGGVYCVSAVLIVAPTVTVGLRIRVRRMKRTGLGADDWTICAALVISTLGPSLERSTLNSWLCVNQVLVWALAIVLIYGW